MIIDKLLDNEIQRNQLMQETYKGEILTLPQGSLSIKAQNGKTYCYLRYRRGDKVVSEYAGSGENAESLRNGIERRKHLQAMLKALKEEHERLVKMGKVK